VAVIDELVLLRTIGGPKVRKAQLEHLIMMAGRPNISLHIIPADAGAYPGIAAGFELATLPDGDVVVYLETSASGQVDQPEEVERQELSTHQELSAGPCLLVVTADCRRRR
jgi:hypothetical protein